jgi:DnaJ family protein C protein 9
MDQDDPITQFFPNQESVDLYNVLSLTSDAKPESIRKAYRRLALVCHPDKHHTANDTAKAEASIKFQQIGFAYAVLSDEARKARYDKTGRTDEGFELAAGEDGWEAYFEEMFQRVTRGKLDEMKKEYQGKLNLRVRHSVIAYNAMTQVLRKSLTISKLPTLAPKVPLPR